MRHISLLRHFTQIPHINPLHVKDVLQLFRVHGHDCEAVQEADKAGNLLCAKVLAYLF